MKRRLLALVTTCLAAAPGFLPGVAAAKGASKKAAPAAPAAADASADKTGDDAEGEDKDSGDADAEGAGETKGQEVAQPAEQPTFKNGVPKPPPDSVAMPNVNATHTVVKGDTLWDLSQHYLGNPWYWPKVWSYNPQIANPHWIYPGNEVKFSAGGGASTDEEAPQEAQPVGEAEDQSGDDEAPMVSASGKIGYVMPQTATFRQDGLITDRELEEAGQITRSTAEKSMLDNLDSFTARFKSQGDAKAGDRFFIFETVRDVNHPITGVHYGYITRVVGTATVSGTENGIATAVIDHTYDEIHRGDYLAPYSDKLNKTVPEKVATKKVEGVVLDNLNDQPFVGASTMVFIDKGRKDGLEEGNVLAVTRQQDGLAGADVTPGQPGYEDSHMPASDIGHLLVIDAKDNASTCLVVQSVREFIAGDRVVTVTTTGRSSPVSLR